MSALIDAGLWTLGPAILLIALVGLGDPFIPRDARLPVRRPVAAALVGLLAISAGVPLWNLAFPLGVRIGALTISSGIGLAILRRRKADLSSAVVLHLVLASVAVAAIYRLSSLVIPIRFLTDTIVYHLPHAEWIARETMPLGVGNLQTRLGFNPGFMTMAAAFRFEPLGQTHLFVTEIAVRALFVLVLADVLRTVRESGDEWARSFAVAIGVVSLPFFAINKSGTDGNIGFLVLIIVLLVVVVHGSASSPVRSDGSLLLLSLVGLAATFKLSSGTAALLLLPLFLGRRRVPVYIIASRRGLPLMSITALAGIGWAIKSFAATGCLIFPVAATCLPVRWGVGAAAADITATHVTAFARRADWAAGSVDLFGLGWVSGWMPTYLTSVPALVVLAATPVAVIGWARTSHRVGDGWPRSIVWLLTALAAAPALLVALSVADLLGGRRFLGVDPAVVGVLEDYPDARVLLLLPVVSLAALLLAAAALPARRSDASVALGHAERTNLPALVPFLVASLIYWFVAAPAVRFGWAPHAVLAALLMTRWVASLDVDAAAARLTPKARTVGLVVGVAATIAVGAARPVLPIFAVEGESTSAFDLQPAAYTVRVPRTVDGCSILFPCSPVPVEDVSATRTQRRLIIVAESPDGSRLLEELGIVPRK